MLSANARLREQKFILSHIHKYFYIYKVAPKCLKIFKACVWDESKVDSGFDYFAADWKRIWPLKVIMHWCGCDLFGWNGFSLFSGLTSWAWWCPWKHRNTEIQTVQIWESRSENKSFRLFCLELAVTQFNLKGLAYQPFSKLLCLFYRI